MNLPEAFLQSLQNVVGYNEAAFKTIHASGEIVTSIRINPAKPNIDTSTLQKIPWSSYGYYLPSRPLFTIDPLFHAGAYYVQEASSMFLEQALRQTVDVTKPLKILDLCAAPGGKSTLIQSLLSDESILVSNEVIKTRVNILAENITKWGASNVVVTNNDPKDFKNLPNYFDVIVIDAPCSGSGLFRKDANAINEWSTDNVNLCSQRQQRILKDVFCALKEDGILIYSTCSYSEMENEEILDWIEEQFSVCSLQLALQNEWGIVETQSKKYNNFGYRFYPYLVKGEGFFISVFKKKSGEISYPKNSKKNNVLPNKNEIEVTINHLTKQKKIEWLKINEELIAIPQTVFDELPFLQNLYIKKAGICVGTVIKNELIPNHDLAVSNYFSSETPSINVDLNTALNFLRKQPFDLHTNLKGWVLLKYEHQAIGWVKILANRINNYYPKEWRILNK